MKSLIVNADDFGFTRDVNQGIVEAHTRGILTATTLMANGQAFEHAVELSRAHPGLDIGCHLVLAGGNSLVTGKPLPATAAKMIPAVLRRHLDPYRELKAQIEKIVAAGVRPTHLDTHKHTHLFPPVLDAVARLANEFGIPWVRRPFDLPLAAGGVPLVRRAVTFALGAMRSRFYRVLTAKGCRFTDHFAGFAITGAFTAADLVALIGALPAGTTEFMCHPGRLGEELRAARTRLKESREQELSALTDPLVRESLLPNGVRLVTFRDLGA